VLEVQNREEPGGQGGLIGHVLALLHAAEVRVAIPDRDGQVALGEAGSAAQVFEQLAEGRELSGGDGGGTLQADLQEKGWRNRGGRPV